MTHPELAHLELLAEVDSLRESLARWVGDLPDWQPAQTCRALVRRLIERTGTLQLRLNAPLVVATLGGTGTGKSALINALVGEEVVDTGRERPTTRRPTLICRPDLGSESLGIDPASVEVVQRDLPALADLVLIDCPDPDTTETTEAGGTNLARLRGVLPSCDLLLVTSTQQKYRSARVADELAAAAAGARLVFVQTHADTDEDVRDDWRRVLEDRYQPGRLFLVDSVGALANARQGREPRGEFAALVDLMTRQLAGSAGARIRRANFLDLVDATLETCKQRIDEALPPIQRLEEALGEHRDRLAAQLANQMRSELLASRRQWEHRLIGKAAARWGFSPFALVLRVFQGLGGLVSGALLFRARTPAQLALWGAVTGARTWQQYRRKRRAEASADRALTGCWDPGQLRAAALIMEGYAAEAGLAREAAGLETLSTEADEAGRDFAANVAGQLDAIIDRLARRHTGWFTRWRYEALLAGMLGFLLFQLGKDFFYDPWVGSNQAPVYGLDFYLLSGFWLLLWCGLLLWAFSSRLRRGLRREINQLADAWNNPAPAAGMFAQLESECRRVNRFRQEMGALEEHVAALRRRLALPEEQLGHRC